MATVLITGAGGGFGARMARTLRHAGHIVAGTLRDITGRNATVAAELSALGVHVYDMDVTSDASVEHTIAQVIAALGTPDVVVNNAGVGVLGVQEAFTATDLQRLFDINVFGAHRVTRAVTPHLRGRGSGLVVFVSSLLGRIAVPFYGPYNASKWALEGLAENYSLELSGFGVDVAIIEPGGFPTTFIPNLMTPSDHARVAALQPLADAGTAFLTGFEQALAANPAQDPQLVADALRDLANAPAGTRPFRTVVDNMGMGPHVAGYNTHLAQITAGIFGAFGTEAMLARRGNAVVADKATA
ncbi:MAG: SDR family NAD(P)-dependent oxidoreductase [Gemmatimonas sp.]|uniref:SDR family NAD(P)-dependent oxidoreductase n=1 Tax=Gemmatimonas sp. TaxID=1962908 RepID=UPI003918CB38